LFGKAWGEGELLILLVWEPAEGERPRCISMMYGLIVERDQIVEGRGGLKEGQALGSAAGRLESGSARL
jgi:hypothetical protein